jgi:hypothetical protein
MKLFRAFVFLASTALFGACGEGMPETSSPENPQQQADTQPQDPQQVIDAAREHAAQDPGVHALATSDIIYPREVKTFATNWFWSTSVHINNPSFDYVHVELSCSRYSTFRWMWLDPRTTWSTSVPCEGTTLYIYNSGGFGSDTSSAPPVYVTVDN